MKLCNDRPKNITMVKDKEGRVLTKDDEIRKRWRDHFTEVLNRSVSSLVSPIGVFCNVLIGCCDLRILNEPKPRMRDDKPMANQGYI